MHKRLIMLNGIYSGLIVLLTVGIFLGTAGQMMTNLTDHPGEMGGWWLLKLLVASLVVAVPMLAGAVKARSGGRLGTAVFLWLAAGITLMVTRLIPSSPVTSTSPERFVVQNIFIAWLGGSFLFAFAQPLQRLLHRWPLVARRHFLLTMTVIYFVLWLFGGRFLLGFGRGTSLVWFIYLFALGDWLANDQDWWSQWSTTILALVTTGTFLLTGVVTWLGAHHVNYSPHHGLTPDTHYLLAVNPCQPLVVITCLLALAWLWRRWGSIRDFQLVQGVLLLNLLCLPDLVRPFLLPNVHWLAVFVLAILLVALLTFLPALLVRWGNAWQPVIAWREVPNWGRNLLSRYWPLALTYAILWGMTVATFAILWDNDWQMVQWALTKRAPIVTVNTLIILSLVLILVALTNRWWLSSGIGIIFYFGWIIASLLKIAARHEPILPTDLSVVTAPREILGMVSPLVLIGALAFIIVLLLAFGWLEHRYGRKIRFTWPWRVGMVLIAVGFLGSFSLANHSSTLTYQRLQKIHDIPYFYSQYRGARMNGTLLQFANNVDVHVMDEPAGYSQAAMERVARRYNRVGGQINRHRTHETVGKQNLVFVLSESFADPSRVPGLHITGGNALPFFHHFKGRTTSGLMLSSGYGGGTANMEYQALTGLSIASFSPTMPTPYSQLVPYQRRTFTINNLFNYSIGLHPFSANLYSRKTVYRKFGFDRFYHFDGGDKITYTGKIQHNKHVSDDATYHEIDLDLHRQPHGKFVQVATMQNHMPYNPSYYDHRQFKVGGSAVQNADQQAQVETYLQGIHYTDQALAGWIHRVDQLRQPTTIVWYGDHLPGIYHGVSMAKNGVRLHETDYFIYSNRAARRLNHDRITNQHQLVSPNDFAAMALAKMDVKVSPYYALLTQVWEKLPAISLPTNGTAKNNTAHEAGIDFIDQHGHHVKLTAKQQQLFHDYQLVQYDLTAGHHYLLKNTFLKNVAK